MARKDDPGPTGEYFDRLRTVELKANGVELKQENHEEICALRYKGIEDAISQIKYFGIRGFVALATIELIGGSGMIRLIAERLGIKLP